MPDNLSIQKKELSQVTTFAPETPIKAETLIDKVQLAKDLLAKLEIKLKTKGDPISFYDTEEDRNLIDNIRAFEFKNGVKGDALLEVETYMHHLYDLEKIANKFREEIPPKAVGYNLSEELTRLYTGFEQVRVTDANNKLTARIEILMGQMSKCEKILGKMNQQRMGDTNNKKNDQLAFTTPEDKKLIDEIKAFKFTNEMGEVLISGDTLFDNKDPFTYKGEENITRLKESITNHVKMATSYVQQNEILLNQNFHMMRDVVQAVTTATKGEADQIKSTQQKTGRH